MVRSSELKRWKIDAGWPHRVLLYWEGRDHRENSQIAEHARDLGSAPIGQDLRFENENYLVFQFADEAIAHEFCRCHQGEMIEKSEIVGRNEWKPLEVSMCNLYNITTTQQAIRDWVKVLDRLGNLEPSLDIWPDRMGPIVRNTAEGREAAMVRWGLPSSQDALKESAEKRAAGLKKKGTLYDFDDLLRREPDGGTTNVRNLASSHWRRWFGVENRCVVPFTRFAEPDPANKPEVGRVPNAWFAIDETQPLAWFAGIWVPQWTSVRKIKEGFTTNDLYAFLTCKPNDVVFPVHSKAMPVVLTEPDEVETWLTADWKEAKTLQRPLPNEKLILLPPKAVAPAIDAKRTEQMPLL